MGAFAVVVGMLRIVVAWRVVVIKVVLLQTISSLIALLRVL